MHVGQVNRDADSRADTFIIPGSLGPSTGGPSLTDVVIAGACRTPVGKYGRAFRNVEATRLGSIVVAEAVNRAGLVPADI